MHYFTLRAAPNASLLDQSFQIDASRPGPELQLQPKAQLVHEMQQQVQRLYRLKLQRNDTPRREAREGRTLPGGLTLATIM